MGENQNTFEYVKVKVLPSFTSSPMKPHIVRFVHWCVMCVKAKSPDGRHAKQVGNPEHILVIVFDYAFATDMLGGPKISTMAATDPIHGLIFCCCGKERRWPG